jgi:hypothetical protein
MSLPLEVIDRVFARLVATYGRDFSARWEGLDQNAVKSSWGHELGGYEKNLKAIAYALENLPERAPNVIEFRNICRRAPSVQTLQLEPPKFDKAIAEMVMNGTRKVLENSPKVDHKAWARKILDDVAAGMKKSPTVVQMARNAIGEAA